MNYTLLWYLWKLLKMWLSRNLSCGFSQYFLQRRTLKSCGVLCSFLIPQPPLHLFSYLTESSLSTTMAVESCFCLFSCFLTKMSPCCIWDKQEAWKPGLRSPRHNFQTIASIAIITSGTITVRVVVWPYSVAARSLKNEFVHSSFAEWCFLGLTGNWGSWAELSK